MYTQTTISPALYGIYLWLCVQDPIPHFGDDKIYEFPATSETGLYAQFEKIKITTIPSSEIE